MFMSLRKHYYRITYCATLFTCLCGQNQFNSNPQMQTHQRTCCYKKGQKHRYKPKPKHLIKVQGRSVRCPSWFGATCSGHSALRSGMIGQREREIFPGRSGSDPPFYYNQQTGSRVARTLPDRKVEVDYRSTCMTARRRIDSSM